MLLLYLAAGILSLGWVQAQGGNYTSIVCIDACLRPAYCNPEEFLSYPDPEGDCSGYFRCNTNREWFWQSCGAGAKFDLNICECQDANVPGITCQEKCPPVSNPEPGPCDVVPPECVVGAKYPDKANCSLYYECNSTRQLELKHCQAPFENCTVGFPCVFDQYREECLIPDTDTCLNRCPLDRVTTTTTEPPPTEPPVKEYNIGAVIAGTACGSIAVTVLVMLSGYFMYMKYKASGFSKPKNSVAPCEIDLHDQYDAPVPDG